MEEQNTISQDHDIIVRAAFLRALALYPEYAARYEALAPRDLYALTPKPIRMGWALDEIQKHYAQTIAQTKAQSVRVGNFLFDPLHNVLFSDGAGTSVRLTDKEGEILRILLEQAHVPLSRPALLQKIWGYGSNIETHTLETHIYRLRQKIEADPTAPKVLVTVEAGYVLKGL